MYTAGGVPSRCTPPRVHPMLHHGLTMTAARGDVRYSTWPSRHGRAVLALRSMTSDQYCSSMFVGSYDSSPTRH